MSAVLEFLGAPGLTTPAGAVSNGALLGSVSLFALGGALAVAGAAKGISSQRIVVEEWTNQSAPSDFERLGKVKLSRQAKQFALLGLCGLVLGVGTLLSAKFPPPPPPIKPLATGEYKTYSVGPGGVKALP